MSSSMRGRPPSDSSDPTSTTIAVVDQLADDISDGSGTQPGSRPEILAAAGTAESTGTREQLPCSLAGDPASYRDAAPQHRHPQISKLVTSFTIKEPLM